jgi:hypothetical protein
MGERSFSDHMHHAFQFPEHLMVGESKNSIALRFEPGAAFLVDFLPRFKIMTLTVELDDQSRRMTDEIGYVVPQRYLPAETKTLDPMRLDVAPQQSLGMGHPVPQVLRSTSMLFGYCGMGHVSDPPP